MTSKPRFLSAKVAAFSLIELMTVVVVLSILAVMVAGMIGGLQERAAHTRCVANLKNLYASTSLYIQERGSWPQVDFKLLQVDEKDYARAWIEALSPFGLAQINWICPSIQKGLDDPDLADPENLRVDYIANPFDSRPIAPYEFSTQPWFAERGDPHGKGNLVILTNGRILSLRELAAH
jgi:prepilin-type N-terminal cleavage/methylation domain-containing protein